MMLPLMSTLDGAESAALAVEDAHILEQNRWLRRLRLGLGSSVVWKDAGQQRHESDNLSAGHHDVLSLMRWLWNEYLRLVERRV